MAYFTGYKFQTAGLRAWNTGVKVVRSNENSKLDMQGDVSDNTMELIILIKLAVPF